MVAVDCYTSQKVLLNVIKNSKYSRIPVYEEDLDDIIGIFSSKRFNNAV